jgi:alpha-methylacyl-CoA racemase
MAAGLWSDTRGANLLDSGAPFYDTYETADARHIAVGCLEPRFFAEFARLLPLDERFVSGQYDRTLWPEMRATIADRVGQKTRDDWANLFAATDACVAPVLSPREARDHPHNRARNAFVTSGVLDRPAPAPRFSRSRPTLARMPADHDRQAAMAMVLARFGLSESETKALVKSGAID